MSAAAPLLSIIIPCYNHGKFIEEALESLRGIDASLSWEALIIDDGSTDPLTQKIIHQLQEDPGYRVIVQKNQGVCHARNRGIEQARGKYILPLDADNRIHGTYPKIAIERMEAQPEIDIVYGQGQYMGSRSGPLRQPPFHLQALMLDNYIDVCAVFRRAVWESTGGFDPQMRTGLEDWEFWLHAAFKGFRFQQIPDLGFDYRVSQDSRNARFSARKQNINEIMDYLIKKHPQHYGPDQIEKLFFYRFKKSPLGFLGKLLLKQYFPRYFQRLADKGRIRKYFF